MIEKIFDSKGLLSKTTMKLSFVAVSEWDITTPEAYSSKSVNGRNLK